MSDALAAPLAELVDAPDSKSGSERSAGSIPAGGTSSKARAHIANLVGQADLCLHVSDTNR